MNWSKASQRIFIGLAVIVGMFDVGLLVAGGIEATFSARI